MPYVSTSERPIYLYKPQIKVQPYFYIKHPPYFNLGFNHIFIFTSFHYLFYTSFFLGNFTAKADAPPRPYSEPQLTLGSTHQNLPYSIILARYIKLDTAGIEPTTRVLCLMYLLNSDRITYINHRLKYYPIIPSNTLRLYESL